MMPSFRGLLIAGTFFGALCAASARGQDPRALRAQAQADPIQENQVTLLCKAADLAPSNKEWRNDCDRARSATISSDRQSLKTAQDAKAAGDVRKVRRYAGYVSSLDPSLFSQAKQLLQDLDKPVIAAVPPPPPPSQNAVLAQATTAYDSGNLAGAKSAALSVTDPSLKSTAAILLANIDRYSGYVAAGQRLEQSGKYADAERYYQLALDLNSHVSADGLAARTQRMQQQLAATVAPRNPVVAVVEPPKATVPAVVKPKPADKPAETVEDKKRRLLSESALAMTRNDLDEAGRKFKQVLDLDPLNAEAKRGLEEITAALSKDPVQLEKTLREALRAFYASDFEAAESRFNRYLGADGGKKKGAAYFYLGATEATRALLDDAAKRASRTRDARENFKQARLAGYQPLESYVPARILEMWKSGGL